MRIKDTLLFGKYQLIRCIGQGRSGRVLLAFHVELKDYRAIKQVPKNCLSYEQFLREALMLKELRHPGIPIVYDVEEDSEYSYLIEEFLEGNSVYDLVMDQGYLLQEAAIRYGIQICSLINYLHLAEKTPVLHLDLQPKNLLLCHEKIKLIDFGSAAVLTDANAARKRYGTPGYCAPEQRQQEDVLDVRTDVYAIGGLLYFMVTGTHPESSSLDVDSERPHSGQRPGRRLEVVIRTCLDPDKEKRYQTVQDVQQALEHLDQKSGVFKKKDQSSLIIALIGSKPGVGTTHLGFGLSVYLNKKGYPNLYEEHNSSGAAAAMAGYLGVRADSYGIFRAAGLNIKPDYGPTVRLREPDYDIVIRDYGSEVHRFQRLEEADLLLLIKGGKWWDTRECPKDQERLLAHPGLSVIYNQVHRQIRLMPEQALKDKCCFQMPCFPNPFFPGRDTEDCMRAILNSHVKTGKGGFFFRRCFQDICKSILRV